MKYNIRFISFILLSYLNVYALTDAELAQIARKFAPEVRFHKDEKYFPTSVEWFAQRAVLKKRQGSQEITILPQPITNVSQLAQYRTKDFPKGFDEVNDYFLDLDKSDANRKKNRAGMPIINGKSTAPMYVHIKERANGGLVLQYIFFFAHQGRTIGPKKLGFIPIDVGMHEGDWEHIDVYLHKTEKGYQPEYVYFAAHGSKPFGEMLPAAKVTFVDGTHPVVYAAQYGHASHSYNIGFDINTLDYTSEGGVKWRGWENELINLGDRQNPAPGQEWIVFGGRWGSTKESESMVSAQRSNSPPGPAIDSAWWRDNANQLTLIKKMRANAGSGRVSKYYDLKNDRIPTRSFRVQWNIDHPQKDDIEFSVNEYKYLRSDRKNIGGRLRNGSITPADPYKEKGIYIADLKSKSGKSIQGEVIIKLMNIEE